MSLTKVNIIECPRKPMANIIHLSFADSDLNWFVGEKLKAMKPCSCPNLSNASEGTAFYTALFRFIEANMSKKGILVCSDFKVGDNFNMMFSSSVNYKRMFGVISKSIKNAASAYQFYDKEMFNLCGKAKRSEFNYYLKRIKFSLTVMVDKRTAEKVKDVFALDGAPNAGESTKPHSLSVARGDSTFMILKCNSWLAVILAKMLSEVYKLSCLPSSEGVIVYGEGSFKKRSGSISKESIVKYLTLNYTRSGFRDFDLNIKWTLMTSAGDIPSNVGSLESVASALDKAL